MLDYSHLLFPFWPTVSLTARLPIVATSQLVRAFVGPWAHSLPLASLTPPEPLHYLSLAAMVPHLNCLTWMLSTVRIWRKAQ